MTRETPELRRVDAGGRTIVVARSAGYCYGVQRALRIAREAADRLAAPIATLGPIIHNPGVVEELAARGVCAVDSPAEVDSGAVLVRTHGVPPGVVEDARRRGLEVIDATCPFVAAAQRKAAALVDAGYVVILLGEREHPEMVGIVARAGGDTIVVEDASELDVDELRGARVGVVVQTTQTREALAALAARVVPAAREALIHNTICEATVQRQAEAREMARAVDCVIVVGGHNSANTCRLASLCGEIQPRTQHIERADELDVECLTDCATIGVTAGASTPETDIAATVEALAGLPPLP